MPDEPVQESREAIILFHWLAVSLGRLPLTEISVWWTHTIKRDNSSETSPTHVFYLNEALVSHLRPLIFQNFQQPEFKKQTTDSTSPPTPALDCSGAWCFDFFLWSSQRKWAERDFCALYLVILQQLHVDMEINIYGFYF